MDRDEIMFWMTPAGTLRWVACFILSTAAGRLMAKVLASRAA